MRCGVVLGRNGGMIQSMLLPFSLGLGGPIQPGTQPLPWIHIDDLCNLIKFSIETPKVNGIINCVAPDIITNAEFTKVNTLKLVNIKSNFHESHFIRHLQKLCVDLPSFLCQNK